MKRFDNSLFTLIIAYSSKVWGRQDFFMFLNSLPRLDIFD